MPRARSPTADSAITFIVADGKITAIETFAAACPSVYVQTRDGWSYRGEILRNLATPGAAPTATLELGPASCAANGYYVPLP